MAAEAVRLEGECEALFAPVTGYEQGFLIKNLLEISI
jgi:hypothetical protein